MSKVTWIHLLSMAFILTKPFAVLAQQFNDLPALFDVISPNELKAANLNASPLLQAPTVRRVRFVKINYTVLAERVTRTDAALGAEPIVRLNLFDDVDFNLVRESVSKVSDNKVNVVGHSKSDMLDRAVLVVANGQITGHVSLGGTLYQIRPVRGTSNVQTIVEVNQGAFPDELDPTAPKIDETQPEEDHLPKLAGPPVIDVMVVYTGEAMRASNDIESEIELAVLETNDAYKQSEIDQRIRLVRAEQVPYEESGDMTKDRDRLQAPNDGFLDSVHALRNRYKADLVSLWVEKGGYCGIAYIMKKLSKSFAPYGFCVVRRDCATGYYSFGHELGHIMGARHDRRVDPTDHSPFTYNHGFANPAKGWRTIMGYDTVCQEQGIRCKRLKYWSNPAVRYKGERMGVAGPGPSAADNHLTLNNTGQTVAAFRGESPAAIVRHDEREITMTAPGVARAGIQKEGAPALAALSEHSSEGFDGKWQLNDFAGTLEIKGNEWRHPEMGIADLLKGRGPTNYEVQYRHHRGVLCDYRIKKTNDGQRLILEPANPTQPVDSCPSGILLKIGS